MPSAPRRSWPPLLCRHPQLTAVRSQSLVCCVAGQSCSNMDPNKLTAKASEAISAAAELAPEAGNPQLTPIHLAIALFEDPDGLGKQVQNTSTSLMRSLCGCF